MSNAILPSLPGLSWGITKKPLWSTKVSDAISGRQYTLSRRLYPLWTFRMSYEVLRATTAFTELQQLVGFMNSRKGRYDDWLYLDPRDNLATAQAFAIGDNVTKAFELVRNFGGFVEPVGGVNSDTLQVYKAGVLQTLTTHYTLSADLRVVTFVTAPTAGQALTWTGQYYFRCRFTTDEFSFEEFMQNKWKADVEFRTFRP
jgi:uncharacterized protein (TIGR02217 family)